MDADIFVSGKKKLRIQKYSDTCGRGLREDRFWLVWFIVLKRLQTCWTQFEPTCSNRCPLLTAEAFQAWSRPSVVGEAHLRLVPARITFSRENERRIVPLGSINLLKQHLLRFKRHISTLEWKSALKMKGQQKSCFFFVMPRNCRLLSFKKNMGRSYSSQSRWQYVQINKLRKYNVFLLQLFLNVQATSLLMHRIETCTTEEGQNVTTNSKQNGIVFKAKQEGSWQLLVHQSTDVTRIFQDGWTATIQMLKMAL